MMLKPNASADVCCRSSSGNAKLRKNSKSSVTPCHGSDQASQTHNHLKRCCSSNGKAANTARATSGQRKYLTPVKHKTPPKVVSKEEYEKYQEYVRGPTKEEQEAALAAAEEEREKLARESMKRKEEFRKIDLMRSQHKDVKLSEIDEEARKRTMYILERAHNMRLEQEEEIQRCNRIILETKCRAIRDAQIAEKKLIEQELAEEEKRLNDMMENERRWAIKEEIKKEQEEVAKRQRFVNILKEQIIENEEHRLLEFERKKEESRLINLSNIAWQQEETAKLRNKEAENAKIRQELAEANEQLKYFKAIEEEQNRIIDLRIKEYQEFKVEREAKIAEERRQEKLKKERDKQRLAMRALQAQDLQAHIDEINAARVQEEVEREWRQREKEEAIKRAETLKLLQKERENQITCKKIMQAIELERDRREFEKIVRVQQEAFSREKKELEKTQQEALKRRNELLKQVNEKEKERIETRQKMFAEGLAIRTETEMRKKRLKDAMERKCQEMRNNVPEIYVNEVKKMIETLN